jgi:hypothetical protein
MYIRMGVKAVKNLGATSVATKPGHTIALRTPSGRKRASMAC